MTTLTLYTNEEFTIEEAAECSIPGYCFVFPKKTARSIAELPPSAQALLGPTLALAQQIIQEVTQPERIYCLTFCELNPQLHFHLFPRTRALMEAYWQERGEGPVNGPLLFDWARKKYERHNYQGGAPLAELMRKRFSDF